MFLYCSNFHMIKPGVKKAVYTEIEFLPDFCEGSKAFVIK